MDEAFNGFNFSESNDLLNYSDLLEGESKSRYKSIMGKDTDNHDMSWLERFFLDFVIDRESGTSYNETLMTAGKLVTSLFLVINVAFLAASIRLLARDQPLKHPVYFVILQVSRYSLSFISATKYFKPFPFRSLLFSSLSTCLHFSHSYPSGCRHGQGFPFWLLQYAIQLTSLFGLFFRV